jgi:hypothetical protein
MNYLHASENGSARIASDKSTSDEFISIRVSELLNMGYNYEEIMTFNKKQITFLYNLMISSRRNLKVEDQLQKQWNYKRMYKSVCRKR